MIATGLRADDGREIVGVDVGGPWVPIACTRSAGSLRLGVPIAAFKWAWASETTTQTTASPRRSISIVPAGDTSQLTTSHRGVSWADEGPVDVGSRIDVTTSLLWYRNVGMVCEVTRFQPDAGVFAYRVVDGPATTENEYRVRPEDHGTRFEMQGRVLLDSIAIRLSASLLKLVEDRMARREVKRLKRLLEGE